ncbi:ABC transporter substrate-binding protein [Ancylomarina longa]|uniref:ABC transporter substrate-binding protein n=1 Tax=Ancylomarina longa TaxID=2487017 RepID=A0A434AX08_9BACT|nr:ABC transporter substrate-binding protein [Ancylomarina longa]RUT79054.1 ABC transporter substrate-binding protein [Ancylomarina longa]
MENQYFKTTDSLLEICTQYPETIKIFASNGFKQLEDEKKRALFGKSLSLEMALKMKKLNVYTFSALLVEGIELNRKQIDGDLNQNKKEQKSDAIQVQGLLPCPVRVPLVEGIEAFISTYEKDHKNEIVYDLKAASMGLDWLIDDVINQDNTDKLADIFISAGFDLFFDENLMGKFKKQNVFADSTGFEHLNKDFDNDEICLKDPQGHYSMIGVVPAVFLVNKQELGDRPIPKTWADIFKPEFKRSVSLPISDFDLFNSMLLHIYKAYGEEGVKGLGTCLLESMHPSQMVKSHTKKKERPAITIMPYFFTKMVKQGGPMIAVWPEDGAIISPIFMLTKKDRLEKTQPVIDFFASEHVGEILSHQGLFPSIHPNVDNRLPKENKFMWLGWDYINNNNIGEMIRKCDTIFNKAIQDESFRNLGPLTYTSQNN